MEYWFGLCVIVWLLQFFPMLLILMQYTITQNISSMQLSYSINCMCVYVHSNRNECFVRLICCVRLIFTHFRARGDPLRLLPCYPSPFFAIACYWSYYLQVKVAVTQLVIHPLLPTMQHACLSAMSKCMRAHMKPKFNLFIRRHSLLIRFQTNGVLLLIY